MCLDALQPVLMRAHAIGKLVTVLKKEAEGFLAVPSVSLPVPAAPAAAGTTTAPATQSTGTALICTNGPC